METGIKSFRNFQDAKTIVVKIGSSTLTHHTGKLDLRQMEQLVRELQDLRNQGKEVLLVSSGAVGAGMGRLGLGKKPRSIPEKQAVAAVGQGILMHMYEKMFAEYGGTVAQVLLTREDMMDRKRFSNARNTLSALLKMNVLPIINENDTVAVEEIRFGDNDTLSAMVASLINADLLVILSDIDGLYSGNPKTDPHAQLINVVEEITPAIEQLAGGAGSDLGTGGMATKIYAARLAMTSGVPVIIAHGRRKQVLSDIVKGEEIGTLFLPKHNRLQTRKKWIAFGSAVKGKIVIDEGACKALIDEGKSLLPSGIVDVQGDFLAGDTVSLARTTGEEIARGVVNYDHNHLMQIKGAKTKDIENILGYKDYDEVIHRDNLVICI
ncbi:glutamate 5-kinase [Thermincola ferriacetica]